jgi:hypothetical protein
MEQTELEPGVEARGLPPEDPNDTRTVWIRGFTNQDVIDIENQARREHVFPSVVYRRYIREGLARDYGKPDLTPVEADLMATPWREALSTLTVRAPTYYLKIVERLARLAGEGRSTIVRRYLREGIQRDFRALSPATQAELQRHFQGLASDYPEDEAAEA